MQVNLVAGDSVELCKDSHDLSTLTIGLGWDPVHPHGEIPAPHLPGTHKSHLEHDLDAIAILLNSNGKIGNLASLGQHDDGGDVIYHKAPIHHSGAIFLTGDNRTGTGAGSNADDEQITVIPALLDPAFEKILFFAVIHDGKHRGQDFSHIKNAYIRAADAQGQEICRFNLTKNAKFAACTALTFAELVRNQDHWCFRALGIPHQSDRFVDLLKPYW